MTSRQLRSRTATKVVVPEMKHDVDRQPAAKRRKESHEAESTKAHCQDSKGHDDGTESSAQNADSEASLLKITEVVGDIFDAPDNTLLIHACNCEGHWGAGIARAFYDRYLNAYKAHADHCEELEHSLLGQAQLIPPMDGNPKHFVGCLFTSRSMGRKKDSPTKILGATKPAVEDLLQKVNEWNAQFGKDGDKVGEVRICQINSGLFNVPWAKTKAVLETIDISAHDVKEIKVVSRE